MNNNNKYSLSNNRYRAASGIVALAFLLVFPVLSIGQQDSATSLRAYYVNTDAGNAGDGSMSSPFNSLDQAENAAEEGDTIYLTGSSLDGGIALKSGQKLLGVSADGTLLRNPEERVRLTNTTDKLDGVIVQLADHNEVAGIHFYDMSNSAISATQSNYSGTHIHHSSFTGTADQHTEDEDGLVFAVSLEAREGVHEDVVIEDSSFRDGFDLGGIKVFHFGDSRGRYLFQRNDFFDIGGRGNFVRTHDRSVAETTILDSTADNIGHGNRNSDSIMPWLMGQSEQVMLVRNFRYKNTKQLGNQSNTGFEGWMYGYPSGDEENWCTACKLTIKFWDSVFENAVTDTIQFANWGTNSQLDLEIHNSRIIGGKPTQVGGGISVILQDVHSSGSRHSILIENTEIIGTTGYGLVLDDWGNGGDQTIIVDLGGGVLGSVGNNRFSANERGDMRITADYVSARNNEWNAEIPTIYTRNIEWSPADRSTWNVEGEIFPDAAVDID